MTTTALAMPDPEDEGTKFEPTLQNPLPSFQCVGIFPDGSRCIEKGVVGLNPQQSVCRIHIKALGKDKQANLKNQARAQVEAAKLRLTQDTNMAIETIESLLLPGTPDAIRLKAATEILDRVGIRGGIEIDLGVEHKDDPMEEVRKRLNRLIETDVTRTIEELELEEAGSDDVIEGTVSEVDGDPETEV